MAVKYSLNSIGEVDISSCVPRRYRRRASAVRSTKRFGDEIAGWADAATEISYPPLLPAGW
jgi:hypothetical protein